MRNLALAHMDHPHYPYSALPTRPRLAFPGGARIAAFVVLYLEHWELAPPAEALRDPRFVGEYGSFFPDFRTWTQREYGNRVGIFRVLDALDDAGIVPAVAANAMAIERTPRLVEELCRRGCEFIAHGVAATRMISARMDEAAERAAIAHCAEVITRATGRRPAGWAGQDFGESARTPQLLAEAGFRYVLDWPNDDQPYLLTTNPAIVSLPNQAEWDDVQQQWLRRLPAHRYPALVAEAFSVLRAEAGDSGRVFGLGVHPWLSGMAARIRYLREALAAIPVAADIWRSTPGAIVGAYTAAVAASTGTGKQKPSDS